MKAVFYNRDFSHRINPPTDFEIERYSWSMIGGPQRAYISGELTGDEWDYMKLLRAPIEIWDEGKCLWWGYVNRVTIPAGEEQRLGLGLDELYNHITVTYVDGDTAAASDLESITEYGQKETRLNNTNADQTAAEQLRDIYLVEHQYARQEIEFSGGSNKISVECYGWFSTLGWKYYSSASNTNTENTAQISTIVTSSGQFLRGTIVEDISGLSSNAYRDGRSTALTYVDQLLNAGTTNILPLLAYVDRDRYVHVYERQPEPPTNQPDYLMRGDGKLITPLGQVIPDKECKTAVWVKVRDVPDTLGGFSAMRPFYIESAEYNVSRDKTTYRAADAYEQIRLAKYVEALISGNNSGSGGVSSYYPYLPVEEHTHILRALHRLGNYASDIAASGTQDLTINTSPTTSTNMTYAGLSYFLPGTDPSGHASWEVLIGGIYNINIYIEYTDGTATPTTGLYMTRIRKRRTNGTHGWLGAHSSAVPSDGWGLAEQTLTVKRKLATGEHLEVWVYNFTDGDVRVNTVEMVVTVDRVTGEPST